MSLFPGTEFNNITEAYSVYGAGAFFVALMNIATDEEKIKHSISAPDDLKLAKRRPDLWNLRITQANTDHEAPYLEKVKELLLGYLGGLTPKIGWEQIAGGTQSFIPYNPNLPEIQAALQAYGLSLKDIAACFSKNGFGGNEWTQAQLNMAGSDCTVLKNALTATPSWTTTTIDTPEKLKIVAGLDDEALYKLVYNGVPAADRSTELSATFINKAGTETALSYTGNAFTKNSLTGDRLKRIQTLHTLAVKLQWDYVTLDAVLTKLGFGTAVTDINMTDLARLAYLSEEWQYSPEGLSGELAILVQSGTNAHDKLKRRAAIAKKLDVPVNALVAETVSCNTLTVLLEKLTKLQRKTETLDSAGINLTVCLTVLALAKMDLLPESSFAKWYNTICTKSDSTKAGFESTPGNDLPKVLFQQWLHELCVYTGMQEPELRGLLLGIFGTDENGTGGGFTRLNTFFNPGTGSGATRQYATQREFFNRLLPYAMLAEKLRLDTTSCIFLGQYIVGTTPSTTPAGRATATITGINMLDETVADTFIQYACTYSRVPEEKNKPVFISALWDTFDIKKFPPIMGWPDDSISTLYDTLKPAGSSSQENIAILDKLSDCFDYAQKTGINAADLLAYVKNISQDTYAALSPAIGMPAKDRPEYTAWRTAHGARLEQDRDRLAPVTLWSLYKAHNDINSPDHLSDYFLCDVSMSGVMDIAPLREATDAVQTFLMRCKAGLENLDFSKMKSVSDEEWQWIPDFRTWQAEQMLRTYPENYLQPTVRSTESDLFKSMVDDLKGNDLTENKAEAAMLNYLDEWMDLVNGEIVDASTYKTYSEYFGMDVETLFLISKSRVKENTFYYNYKETAHDTEATKETSPSYRSRWSQWKEIPVNIHADTVSAIYAFNRLHIFWSEQSTTSDMDPYLPSGASSVPTNRKYTIYNLTIKCVYQHIDGSWSDPKAVRSFPFYIELASTDSVLMSGRIFQGEDYDYQYSKHLIEFNLRFNPSLAYWKKVGVQAVNHDNGNTFIQLFCGPSWDCSTANLVPDFYFTYWSSVTSVDSKLKEIQEFIKSSCKKARSITVENNMPVSIFGISPVLLNHSLDTVVLEDSSEAYAFAALESKYENLRPAFYKKGNSYNIQNADYAWILAENYRGTYGDTVNEFISGRHKQFTNDITKPVKKLFAVRNRVGAYYLELDNAAYIFSLFVPLDSLDAISLDSKTVSNVQVCKSAFKTVSFWASTYRTERVFSPSIHALRVNAHENGLQSLAKIKQEDDIGSPQTKFSDLGGSSTMTGSDSDNQLDYWGAFGIYTREFYFHAPMAISSLLAQNLQQEGAWKWHNMVYNAVGVSGSSADQLKNVWKYRPFHENQKSPAGKNSTSFDPDIIAENDLPVYQHWTIVQHVGFLLDFADNEFRRETWESLNFATQLYFEAEDLLGREPAVSDEVTNYELDAPNRNYNTWKTKDKNEDKLEGGGIKISKHFSVPTNMQLQALWDRVKDRLYKLRNGLNINGEKQMPSMYGSPADPARLGLAAQNGGINPYDDSELSTALPVYRFRELAPHTESLINLVVEFGGQLYSALQQKDSEQLQVLQATHQVNMLNLVSRMYQYQLDEANKEVEMLKANLDAVEQQVTYYTKLVRGGLLPEEAGSITANQVAQGFQESAFAVRSGAFAAHLIPTVFGFSDGAFQPGSSLESAAGTLSEQGMAMQTLSQILAAQAEHIRRAEEWDFEADQAGQNKEGLLRNMEAAAIRVKIAQENIRQYQLQVTQANEVLNYLNTKFTNAELYTWMSGQMASLYFTAYQLALGSLHKLQRAYQYELDDNKTNFIPSGAWNSLKKGLLAGETLKLALANMQDAYMNNNQRKQEVEKIISLNKLFKDLNEQVDWKGCTFSLHTLCGEGQTLKIKSIAVSIPAVIGPYETFDATLENTVAKQQITISKGIDDMGIFQEDANDGRYLPFEGITIANGKSGRDWKFACGKPGISDVILTVKAWVIPGTKK